MRNNLLRLLRDGTIQIVLSVALALTIGVVINKCVSEVPELAVKLVGLPGNVWLRALQAIVIPLILVSMISSMQSLKKIPGDGQKIAKVAIIYYLLTTILALILSIVFVQAILVRTSFRFRICIYL